MMVSGKPLSKEEKAFILANINEQFPTVIARHLALYYSEFNGGSRSTWTVQEFIRRQRRARERTARAVN